MKCEICGKELKNAKALGNHLRFTHKDFNKKVYYDMYIKNQNDGLCKICKKPTTFIDIVNGYKVYCGLECEQQDNPNIKYKVCKICGDYTNAKGFGAHITCKHNMSLQQYYDKYIKVESEGICEKCGSKTEFISISKGYNKLCNNCKCTSNQKMICRICGFETYSLGMPSHLTQKHQMSTKDYYDKFLKEGVCKICGKPTKFGTILTGYNKTCSRKCQYEYQKTDEYLQIIQSTNLEKYGVKAAFNNEKAKQTMLEKYGVVNPAQNPEILAKQQETQRNNHGGKLAWNTEKRKETNRKKYGTDYIVQLEDVQAKAKSTKLSNQLLNNELEDADE